VCLGIFWATSCSQGTQEKPERATSPSDGLHLREGFPAQLVVDGYFEYTENGQIIQSLEAARLERWEEQTGTDEEGLSPLWQVGGGYTLYIGGSREDHTAVLSAQRGTYDDQAGRLEAWDDVVLVNEEGERLETEHLIWSHDSDVVHTQRPVVIHTAQGVLRGKGLRANSRFERYEILSPTGSFDLTLDRDSLPTTPDA